MACRTWQLCRMNKNWSISVHSILATRLHRIERWSVRNKDVARLLKSCATRIVTLAILSRDKVARQNRAIKSHVRHRSESIVVGLCASLGVDIEPFRRSMYMFLGDAFPPPPSSSSPADDLPVSVSAAAASVGTVEVEAPQPHDVSTSLMNDVTLAENVSGSSHVVNGESQAVWRGANGLGRISEVTLRRARLVLGWVTVFGRSYHLSRLPSVGRERSAGQSAMMLCGWGVKAG